MVWPIGRISTNGYGNLSELLHSASAGARAASTSVKIMLHLANGWNWSAVNSFLNQVFLPGKFATSDIDVLGFSFYPFYGTTANLANLRSSLTNVVNKLNKVGQTHHLKEPGLISLLQEVMVVEVNWPYACPGVSLSEPGHPTGTNGQLTFVNNVRSIVESLPNGRGTGIVYWEPAWIGNAGLGSACLVSLAILCVYSWY